MPVETVIRWSAETFILVWNFVFLQSGSLQPVHGQETSANCGRSFASDEQRYNGRALASNVVRRSTSHRHYCSVSETRWTFASVGLRAPSSSSKATTRLHNICHRTGKQSNVREFLHFLYIALSSVCFLTARDGTTTGTFSPVHIFFKLNELDTV